MNNEKRLSSAFQYFLVGGSVFAMHFGGSSMIWPMTWGKESGNQLYIAFSGIFITAVALVYVGYLALVKSNKTMHQMAQDVSKNYAYLFSGIMILVMGPLFCVPRMSAAAWDSILQVFKFHPNSFLPALIFSIIYYLVTYWFICDKTGIIDKLSKVLLPVLIIAVSGIIIKALLFPVGAQEAARYSVHPFAYGFKSGYATGEVVCALLFGNIIIDGLKAKGIGEQYLNKNLKIVCIIGLLILTTTHFGHMYAGSHAGKYGDLKYSALYTEVVIALWGKIGGVIFNIALIFAALTTAVGMSAATADILREVSEDRIDYKLSAIIILVVSATISAMGLGTIVELIGPLIDIIYPPAIVMVIYYCLIKDLDKKPRLLAGYRYAMVVSLIFSSLEGLITYGKYFKMDVTQLENIFHYIPLANMGLGWVIPVAIAIFIGMSIKGNTVMKEDLQ